MRTVVLFDNIDASSSATSTEIQIDKRAQLMFLVELTGTDTDPQIIIEEAFTGGGCLPAPVDYTPIVQNCNCSDPEILIDDSPYKIFTDSWFGNYLRVQYIPNGVTTGTVKVTLAYKDYP